MQLWSKDVVFMDTGRLSGEDNRIALLIFRAGKAIDDAASGIFGSAIGVFFGSGLWHYTMACDLQRKQLI